MWYNGTLRIRAPVGVHEVSMRKVRRPEPTAALRNENMTAIELFRAFTRVQETLDQGMSVQTHDNLMDELFPESSYGCMTDDYAEIETCNVNIHDGGTDICYDVNWTRGAIDVIITAVST
jgi:hypothetical protein